MLSYGFNEFGLSCPNCGATNVYSAEAVDIEGFVDCQNCGKRFHARESDERVETPMTPRPVETEFYDYIEAPEKKRSNAMLWCAIVLIFLFVPVIIAIPAIICILFVKRQQLFGGGKSSGYKTPKSPDTW